MLLVTTYDAQFFTDIELPQGKTKADIQSVSIVWGNIEISFYDGTSLEIPESESWEFADDQKSQRGFEII